MQFALLYSNSSRGKHDLSADCFFFHPLFPLHAVGPGFSGHQQRKNQTYPADKHFGGKLTLWYVFLRDGCPLKTSRWSEYFVKRKLIQVRGEEALVQSLLTAAVFYGGRTVVCYETLIPLNCYKGHPVCGLLPPTSTFWCTYIFAGVIFF